LVFSGIFNLPWGINAAPILQWGSARPYSTNVGSDIYSLSDYSRAGAIVPNSDPTNYTWFNVAPAADKVLVAAADGEPELACQANQTCRQVPIDVLRGQPFFDLDARVGKRVGIGDWGNVNLFFQAFDLTNRANFGSSYDGHITDSSFEQPTGYLDGNGVTVPKSFRGEFGAELTF
ncbi:MAG: TonB-dependent receptor, partial [Terriglobales bacterium]